MAIKQMTLSQEISSGNKNFEVKGDIIVPDIKPDIVNIITSNANTYIYKEEISSGKIRVDGNIDAYIIYISDKGETRSIQTTLDFVETINDENAIEGKQVATNIRLDTLEARILNERKLSIEAKLCIDYQIKDKFSVEINTDFAELSNVEKRTEIVKLDSLVGENKIKTSVKDDLKLNTEEDAGEILKVNFTIENSEVKTSYNKVLAKAELNVQILYITENGKIRKCSANLPIMSFIDIENVAETNKCNVNYYMRNMLVKVNSKETHSIGFQAEFEVCCTALQSEEIMITKDMYSLSNDLELEEKNMKVCMENSINEEAIKINEKISIEKLEEVYSIQVIPKITSSIESGNVLNYEGEASVIVYYISNGNVNLAVKQVNISFVKKSSNSIMTSSLYTQNINYSVSGDDISLDIEIGIRSNNLITKDISYISKVTEKEETEKSEYNMFMYFVKSGDTIWKIAKRFKVKMEDIIKLNNLENPDKINIGDRLYIMK